MSASSALRKGVEAIRRQPALLLAELSWRWCFASAAWLIVASLVIEYLRSIPVSWREQMLVQSGEPLAALAALAHALRGSAVRLAAGIAVGGTTVAVFWIICAAVGRLATLRALVQNAPRWPWRALLGLSFLRAGLWLAAVLSAGAALILSSRVADPAPRLVLAVVLFACIWLVWALLNWLLSLSSIFVVRDGRDTLGGIAAAVEMVRGRFGEVVLTSLPFVLLHYMALAAALAAGILIFDRMLRASLDGGWALATTSIAYFAYADFLYITRLAAYVGLAGPGEMEADLKPATGGTEPSFQPSPGGPECQPVNGC
ncbi:MAG TPA: hypothetical protein VKT29_05375 [Terriglobales bacterium]|nr:hypothetical protein [Terriglobales bacterium]